MIDEELFAMPGKDRAWAVLDRAFRGIHHLPRGRHSVKETVCADGWGFIEANVYNNDLCTFDADVLTRLVIGAHEYCVRLEIDQSGPRMVKLVLHWRNKRDGSMWERHPTIEKAIESYRAGAREGA